MPRYSYIAKTLAGEPSSGTLEAKNEHELARILRNEGCILIEVTLEEGFKKKKFTISFPFFRRISLVEKIMFTRNLRVMISAGISLPRALNILANQTKSKKFRSIISKIEEEIIEGRSFSNGLGKYPNIFSELYSSMVKVGEEAGTLEDVLGVLTEQMEKEHALKSKVIGALVYPVVIVTAMVVIGVLMMIMVIPKLAATFNELGVELPFTTKIVIAFGIFLAKFWYTLPIILLIFFILFRAGAKTKIGKLVISTLILKTPLLNSIIKKTNSAHTARTLSSLITSGVPIVKSLEIVSGTLGNVYYQRAISEAVKKIEKGAKLGEVFKKYENIYPSLFIQMVEIGEETGETSSILGKLADFYEEEVANTTRNLSSIIEPILMIIIGAAVGFFAISMVQPMYSMLGAI